MKPVVCLFISLALTVLLTACTRNMLDVSGCYYPFELYEERPVIALTANCMKMILLVDTGSHVSYIFRSGLKKIVSPDLVKKADGNYDIGHPMTITTDFYPGYLKKTPVTFVYSPSVKETPGIDGILGIDALVNCDYLVINYKKKQVCMIDSEPVCKYWFCAIPDETCFELPLCFENTTIIAKLDTGSDANQLYVQLPKYPKRYREKTVLQSTLYNSGIYAYRRMYVLNYTFPGNSHTFSGPFHDMHAYAEELFPSSAGKVRPDCLLGYPFFKKNVVCLDFKHHRIGILY